MTLGIHARAHIIFVWKWFSRWNIKSIRIPKERIKKKSVYRLCDFHLHLHRSIYFIILISLAGLLVWNTRMPSQRLNISLNWKLYRKKILNHRTVSHLQLFLCDTIDVRHLLFCCCCWCFFVCFDVKRIYSNGCACVRIVSRLHNSELLCRENEGKKSVLTKFSKKIDNDNEIGERAFWGVAFCMRWNHISIKLMLTLMDSIFYTQSKRRTAFILCDSVEHVVSLKHLTFHLNT